MVAILDVFPRFVRTARPEVNAKHRLRFDCARIRAYRASVRLAAAIVAQGDRSFDTDTGSEFRSRATEARIATSSTSTATASNARSSGIM